MSEEKETLSELAQLLEGHGGASVIRDGINAAEDRRSKNRMIFCLVGLLGLSISWNFYQTITAPEPRLLGETPDGRIRPLPLLTDPMYSQKEILGWAEKCVVKIYNLSYVDWQKTIANDTECLSDKAREDFTASLRKVGVLDYLTPEKQGTVYAVPRQPILRKSMAGPGGYSQWVVDVPYRIAVDGKQRGSLDVVMTMRIRRVSLTWRESGIWVDEYIVSPKRSGGGA